MKLVKIYHYDAFSKEPNKGNPAAVVLNGDELTEEEMQKIAERVGFNETAFLIRSEAADFELRYFTPGHEMNLCGHATMAAIYAMKDNGVLKKNNLIIKTRAGILPINIELEKDNKYHVIMKQATPQFQEFGGSYEELAKSIGVEQDDIDAELPVLYGSTGTWTLLIPIKKLCTFKNMKPRNELFPSILKEMPRASVHPFCLETYDAKAQMHARHFSSPYSGTIEDPVTGTASGVMGAYYAKYIKNHIEENLNLIVEQGHEIGRDGKVLVRVSKSMGSYDIEIAGNAVYVKEFDLEI
jgi:PhzF family phenazine biosynthesis protein